MRPVYNDELYHYGKTGMKWGKRTSSPTLGSKIKRHAKAEVQMYKDAIKHPINSNIEQFKLIKNHPIKAIIGGTKTIEQLNSDVAKRVANSQKNKKTIQEHKDTGAKHVNNVLKSIGINK